MTSEKGKPAKWGAEADEEWGQVKEGRGLNGVIRRERESGVEGKGVLVVGLTRWKKE